MSQTDPQLLSQIQQARDLRHDDQLDESQELLLALLEANPDDPLVLFEVGGSFDVLGDEEQAVPYYRAAVEAGLSGNERQECLVCLGSSLRVIGEYDAAVEVLEQAAEEFPKNNSSRAFLALAYYSNGQPDEAVRLLLDLLLTTTNDSDILAFSDALEYYRDDLDLNADEDE